MTVGVAQFLGSSPKSPTPLDTTTRIYALSNLFFLIVSIIISANSSFLCGISNIMECADSYKRFTCSVNLYTFPSYARIPRSEEHTSELQSRFDLECSILL